MLIHVAQDMTTWVGAVSWMTDVSSWHPGYDWLHLDWSLLAQQFETDVFAGARRAFNNFIQSGQVWALLIGMLLGYILRGITTYN